jgi:hypothetical protein
LEEIFPFSIGKHSLSIVVCYSRLKDEAGEMASETRLVMNIVALGRMFLGGKTVQFEDSD